MRRTTITILDEELWRWARKRAIDLGLKTSEYLFELMRRDKEGKVDWR